MPDASLASVRHMTWVPWTPAAPAQQQLRALLTARETLVQERLRLNNRQHAAGYTASQALVTELQAPVLAAIAAQIAHIDRELAKLAAADTALGAQVRVIVTIPGLGLTTAGALLASLPLDRLETSRQVAAYVGLCPQERSSGSSLRGRGHVGPLGPAFLRKALYLPAIVAIRANPPVRAFAKGKLPKVVITAVMRKLLLLAWTLLRTGQPFSPTHGQQSAGAWQARRYPHRGEYWAYPLWQMLVHLVNHGTLHRSEVAELLTRLNSPPPGLDPLIYFGETS
jgi:transposase